MDLLATNLVIVNKDSTVNRVGNSKINRAKIDAKMAKSKNQYKSKGENLVKFFLTQALAQGSKLGFLTPGAK